MELIIPFDILKLIFGFLDKKNICIYDTALLSKERRSIFLEVLKYLNIKNMCEWTYSRNIKIKTGICPYYNIMYIPETCESLIISSGIERRTSYNKYFDINNNNIKYLHADLFNSYGFLRSLEGKKLEIIKLIHCKGRISPYILDNIKIRCPNLKKIMLIGHNDIQVLNYSGIDVIIKYF